MRGNKYRVPLILASAAFYMTVGFSIWLNGWPYFEVKDPIYIGVMSIAVGIGSVQLWAGLQQKL